MNRFPENLLQGYREFVRNRYSPERGRYVALATEGQKPETLMIACCDSRAAPETIFNCGPGELFVVRNVANLVPPHAPGDTPCSVSAALEFAVLSLEVKHIVVMGHAGCGGIQAALNANSEPLSPGNFIGKWTDTVTPLAEEVQGLESPDVAECQTALERRSVRNSVDNLLTFPWIEVRVECGKLRVHGAWFDIGAGELWVMSGDSGEFERQSDIKAK